MDVNFKISSFEDEQLEYAKSLLTSEDPNLRKLASEVIRINAQIVEAVRIMNDANQRR